MRAIGLLEHAGVDASLVQLFLQAVQVKLVEQSVGVDGCRCKVSAVALAKEGEEA